MLIDIYQHAGTLKFVSVRAKESITDFFSKKAIKGTDLRPLGKEVDLDDSGIIGLKPDEIRKQIEDRGYGLHEVNLMVNVSSLKKPY